MKDKNRRHSPAHLVLVTSGGPGGPVPPSPGLDSRTLISYSTSGSRCHSLQVGESTTWVSAQFPDVVRYSTSFRMIGPSPMMLLALGLIQRQVAPTARSSGGAMGVGGAVKKRGGGLFKFQTFLSFVVQNSIKHVLPAGSCTSNASPCFDWNCIPT